MPFIHPNFCDCPRGKCRCGDTRITGAILYDPVINDHIWINTELAYNFGDVVNFLWDPNGHGIIFISNESWIPEGDQTCLN